MCKLWVRIAIKLGVLTLFLTSGSVFAQGCDFVTGGGFIFFNSSRANFGVGGGCKDGSPTFGHLEYVDHGMGLNVHWTSITGYFDLGGNGVDDHGQPTGTRRVCGTARTNLFGDVDFAVTVTDAGEPGVNDTFDIRLRQAGGGLVVYDTATQCSPHFLGSPVPCAPGTNGGGNIQLHKPNPSTLTGAFGGSCPAQGSGA
jgi:hypothetical protein